MHDITSYTLYDTFNRAYYTVLIPRKILQTGIYSPSQLIYVIKDVVILEINWVNILDIHLKFRLLGHYLFQKINASGFLKQHSEYLLLTSVL